MDVAADCDGGVDNLDIGFLDQQFAGLVAELSHGGFGDGFAGPQLGDCAVGGGFVSVPESISEPISESGRALLVEITHD